MDEREGKPDLAQREKERDLPEHAGYCGNQEMLRLGYEALKRLRQNLDKGYTVVLYE